MRIAIMQPYFMPYVGYFRLLYHTDLFVIYDCVQYQRRGYIHRNRLPSQSGALSWLTLPIELPDVNTKISEVLLKKDAEVILAQRIRKFDCLKTLHLDAELNCGILSAETNLTNYLHKLLDIISSRLAMNTPIIRSSELCLGPEFRGEERIIEIAKQLGALKYLNAPGGVGLYSADKFGQAGIELEFLNTFKFSNVSILYRLLFDSLDQINRELTEW